jgi:hypothetical protein
VANNGFLAISAISSSVCMQGKIKTCSGDVSDETSVIPRLSSIPARRCAWNKSSFEKQWNKKRTLL